jgi:predicted acylesterase/phospholipase RssA
MTMARKTYGLILAGAVAKGPFHAGVLSELSKRDLSFASVVGTSAGALNAAVYAAGIAYGRPAHAAQVLEELWLEEANWWHVLAPSPIDLVLWRGFSKTWRLEKIVREALERVADGNAAGEVVGQARPKLALRLIATYHEGQNKKHKENQEQPGKGASEPSMTTYEHAFEFSEQDLMTSEGRDRIAKAATASASFPGLFIPPELPPAVGDEHTGHFADGGALNNAPISYVLNVRDTDAVIVVSAQPEIMPPPESLRGLRLAMHLVDVLVNERLFRDLRRAIRNNQRIEQIESALQSSHATPEVRDAVFAALGWRGLEVISVRPATELPGNAFAGLSCRSLRAGYIESGKAAAQAALAKPPPPVLAQPPATLAPA